MTNAKIQTGVIGVGAENVNISDLHETEAAAMGLELSCARFDLADAAFAGRTLGELLDLAECRGFAGLYVTDPLKEAVVPFADVLSPEAEALGLVDMIIFGAHCRFGHNTSSLGYGESFRRSLSGAALRRVVQLGAGAAGLAVAYALLRNGAQELVLVEPDDARARRLAEVIDRSCGKGRVELSSELGPALAGATGLVNVDTAGALKEHAPVRLEGWLHPGLWVADLGCASLDTKLLRSARRAGCRTLDGRELALAQLAETFRLFTGRTPDRSRTRANLIAEGAACGEGC